MTDRTTDGHASSGSFTSNKVEAGRRMRKILTYIIQLKRLYLRCELVIVILLNSSVIPCLAWECDRGDNWADCSAREGGRGQGRQSRAQLGRGALWAPAPPAFHTLAKDVSNRGETHFTLRLRACIISSLLVKMYLRPPLKITPLRPCRPLYYQKRVFNRRRLSFASLLTGWILCMGHAYICTYI